MSRPAEYLKLPLRDGMAAGASARLGLKQWIGFGIIHPDWFLTAFFTDAGYLVSAAFYAHDRRTGCAYEHLRSAPPAQGFLPPTMWEGSALLRRRGFMMSLETSLSDGRHIFRAEIMESRGAPAVSAEINLLEDISGVKPLVARIALENGRSVYTHKAPFPVSGRAVIGGERIILDPGRDIAILDEHRSFLPYNVSWRWATFAGRDERVGIIGLNLGDHDFIPEQESRNENCVWVGNEIYRLGAASFRFDRNNGMKRWEIGESLGSDFEFMPEGEKKAVHRIGPVRMDYHQFCGRFRGRAVLPSGDSFRIDDYYGVAETMDASF